MVTTVLPRVGRAATSSDLNLVDLETVRLLLRGESVIDWHRLSYQDLAEVDRFLRLNEFDPESDDEMGRLEDLRADAVDYLSRTFGMTISDDVAGELPARDLFLVASSHGPHQKQACVTLKVMHIIHHLNGRAALLKMPVSDEIIFREVELKVLSVVEQLRAAGAPIAEFEWSRKPRDSQITKLLAKRSTIAANIYDKLRFRLIVPTQEDLIPTLATLTRQLIPFNYVVPGESVNQLIDLGAIARAHQRASSHGALPSEPFLPYNEFSGPEYRIVNFVADLPLRLERIMPKAEIPHDLCHVVFVLTEFQVADKATSIKNESGASSHEAYKARQRERVRQRLFRDKDEPLPPD
ncbi:MAG: TIGR04552 family protein [Proteobacteria bacterium]|nr:TIGR04552 family protein [Pseudomonadota bacterium]